MNIAPTGPTTATASSTRGDGGTIAGFEDFLRLLTAQLEQQDPLAPMDSEKFTQQLIEFSAVEHARRTNERLSQLIETVAAGQLLTAAGYVGREVEFAGEEVFLGDSGRAEVAYSLSRHAAKAELVVRDASGKEIVRQPVPNDAGAHRVTWDGRDAAGLAVPGGVYRVEILAVDEAGARVEADLRTVGRIDAVLLENGTLLLSAGGLSRPATSVTAIRAGTAG